MCGIIGLMVKNEAGRALLGRMVIPMFECMAERGPDSAGLAVFGAPVDGGLYRFSLFARDDCYDWGALVAALRKETPESVELHPVLNHAVLIGGVEPGKLASWLAGWDSSVRLLSVGRSIEVYKDAGDPRSIAQRYRFDELRGSHCVGHTRMATESQVSPAHAHPFTAGMDFCLVHNGTLSNPHKVCRMLEAEGIEVETDNDSEVACRFLQWLMQRGDTLEQALEAGFMELDGFYTFLIATEDTLTLVRDALGCKPAVVAETNDYVAISSEFRALAHLPGIEEGSIFEPLPERIYSWKVDAWTT